MLYADTSPLYKLSYDLLPRITGKLQFNKNIHKVFLSVSFMIPLSTWLVTSGFVADICLEFQIFVNSGICYPSRANPWSIMMPSNFSGYLNDHSDTTKKAVSKKEFIILDHSLKIQFGGFNWGFGWCGCQTGWGWLYVLFVGGLENCVN